MNINFNTLKVKSHNKYILIVTLNRPEVRNAINDEMADDFIKLCHNISSEFRCIILTGEGSAFCAGADLKERKNISVADWKKKVINLREAVYQLMHLPVPVISAVNGSAFGGGLELVPASDFAYAADNAIFSQSEVKIGIIPGALGTQNLPKSCGIKRAKELMFTGQIFSAQDAFNWGIVNKICKPKELQTDILTTAENISANAPLAIKEAKKAINISFECDLDEGFYKEFSFYENILLSKDREEGIKAFNEKRKPIFIGE